MRVPLTGVANKQIVPIHISGVNDGTATADVPFGFLIADADASRVVDKPNRTVIQGQLNQPALASAASTVLFVVMLVVGLLQITLLRRAGRQD